MKELYIDFDGVILNTIEIGYKNLKKLGINTKDHDKVIEYFKNIDWKYFLKETKQINNSIECIQKIIDSKKFKVVILTHVCTLEEAVQKIEYIRKYFKDINFIPVPKHLSKTKMVNCKDAILIDDYSENLVEWEQCQGIGIRFSEKLESSRFPTINKLDQILDMDI